MSASLANSYCKKFIDAFVSPILARAVRKLRRRTAVRDDRNIEWQCIPEGWRRAATDAHIKGWNETSVVERYRLRLEEARRNAQAQLPFGQEDVRTFSTFGNLVRMRPSANIVATCLKRSMRFHEFTK